MSLKRYMWATSCSCVKNKGRMLTALASQPLACRQVFFDWSLDWTLFSKCLIGCYWFCSPFLLFKIKHLRTDSHRCLATTNKTDAFTFNNFRLSVIHFTLNHYFCIFFHPNFINQSRSSPVLTPLQVFDCSRFRPPLTWSQVLNSFGFIF